MQRDYFVLVHIKHCPRSLVFQSFESRIQIAKVVGPIALGTNVICSYLELS